ncbi:hypothetical protein ACWDOR_21695 [Streptosporangium canum]
MPSDQLKLAPRQASTAGWRTPENIYALLAALPTDPDALPAEFRKIHEIEGADQDDWTFERFAATLSRNIVPPDLQAAIFRAIAKLPGVMVNGSAVDADGRAVLSVSHIVEGWRHFEILLDPATYAYRGRRETAIRDYEERGPRPGVEKFIVKDGKRVPMAPRVEWSIEKGTTWQIPTRTRWASSTRPDRSRRPGSGPALADSAPPHLHDYRGAVMSVIGSPSTSTRSPEPGRHRPFQERSRSQEAMAAPI